MTTTTSSKSANEMRNAELNLKEATVIYDFYDSKIAQTSAKVGKARLLPLVLFRVTIMSDDNVRASFLLTTRRVRSSIFLLSFPWAHAGLEPLTFRIPLPLPVSLLHHYNTRLTLEK